MVCVVTLTIYLCAKYLGRLFTYVMYTEIVSSPYNKKAFNIVLNGFSLKKIEFQHRLLMRTHGKMLLYTFNACDYVNSTASMGARYHNEGSSTIFSTSRFILAVKNLMLIAPSRADDIVDVVIRAAQRNKFEFILIDFAFVTKDLDFPRRKLFLAASMCSTGIRDQFVRTLCDNDEIRKLALLV